MTIDEAQTKIRMALDGMESDGKPVKLALVFGDGGVSLDVNGRPVSEAVAAYLAPVVADLDEL